MVSGRTRGIGLPVWLHLLKQHKTTPLPFSSLMFFERRTQSSIKHRRLQYLLLFALRTALLRAIGSGFRKAVREFGDSGFGERRQAAGHGGGQLVQHAPGRSPRSREIGGGRVALGHCVPKIAGLMLAFGSQAHLMGEPSSDASVLRGEIRAIQPSDDRSSYAELARALQVPGTIGANARRGALVFGHAEIVHAAQLRPTSNWARGSRSFRIPWPDRTLANFAVESVTAPRRLYDPKKVRIQATVDCFRRRRGPAARGPLAQWP